MQKISLKCYSILLLSASLGSIVVADEQVVAAPVTTQIPGKPDANIPTKDASTSTKKVEEQPVKEKKKETTPAVEAQPKTQTPVTPIQAMLEAYRGLQTTREKTEQAKKSSQLDLAQKQKEVIGALASIANAQEDSNKKYEQAAGELQSKLSNLKKIIDSTEAEKKTQNDILATLTKSKKENEQTFAQKAEKARAEETKAQKEHDTLVAKVQVEDEQANSTWEQCFDAIYEGCSDKGKTTNQCRMEIFESINSCYTGAAREQLLKGAEDAATRHEKGHTQALDAQKKKLNEMAVTFDEETKKLKAKNENTLQDEKAFGDKKGVAGAVVGLVVGAGATYFNFKK